MVKEGPSCSIERCGKCGSRKAAHDQIRWRSIVVNSSDAKTLDDDNNNNNNINNFYGA